MTRNRILATAATVALAWGMVGGVGPAHAQQNDSQWCREFAEPLLEELLDADVSHGGCVSTAESGNFTALISSLCKDPELRAHAELLAGEKLNQGKCIAFVKALAEGAS